MRKLFPVLILACALFAWPAPAPAQEQRQVLDQVVAVVNEQAITQSELDTYLRPFYEEMKKEYQGERLMQAVAEARRKLLSQLIEDHLVYQEAQKQKIEIEETEINQDMEDLRKRFPTEREFEDALKKEGLSVNDMRERIRRQAMIRRLQDMEIRSKIVVSPLEIQDYYEKNQGEFSEKERIKIRALTIKKNDEARIKGLTDEAAKDRIDRLRERILKEEDFAKMAIENSEDAAAKKGGLSDWIQRGEMITEIDAVIFALKAGEMSEVIETPMGYHLFRMEEREQEQKRSLEEARENIYARIFRQKSLERFRDWMDQLKRSAYISIR